MLSLIPLTPGISLVDHLNAGLGREVELIDALWVDRLLTFMRILASFPDLAALSLPNHTNHPS